MRVIITHRGVCNNDLNRLRWTRGGPDRLQKVQTEHCTGDDESNIMAGVEAKELGAKKVLSVVGRPDYANIMGKIGIDFAVSERQAMGKQILGLLNEGNIISRYLTPDERIGIYELEVEPESDAVRMNLADLPLPEPCLIAALMRDRYSRVPEAGDKLQVGDIVVAFIDESVVEQAIPCFRTSKSRPS